MASVPASDLLRADHRRIEMVLDRLLTTVKHPGEGMALQVRDIFAEIQRLMEPHVHKEENVFYPYLRAAFSELLAEMDEQHEYIAEVTAGIDELTGLAGKGLTERQLLELIRLSMELFDAIQHHIVEEEDRLLRLADLHLSVVEQDCLAARMEGLEVGSKPIGTTGLGGCEKGGATC
jgi:hemerythrin-like domain-containing protein